MAIFIFPYADKSLTQALGPNKFYSQNPTGAKPEYALINGQVVKVTNTGVNSQGYAADNVNIINLGAPPISGNRVTGVILEMWRALLNPNSNYTNGVSVKPGPLAVIDTFYGIYMQDANVGWLCGQNGTIYITSDGGNDWINIDSGTKRQLNGIHFINSTVGWSVGENGTIIRSSNGGQTWNPLEESTVVSLNSVFAASSTNIWAVGDLGVILRSTNGVTFVPYSSNVTYNLNKVFFSDANHGWIVGDGGNILMTSNGGVSWSVSPSITTEKLNSVHFYNENYGFAVGDNGTILESTTGGNSWVSRSGNVTGGAITTNLHDVTMVPKLDEESLEEVSSQLGSTGNTFKVQYTPITGKDRKGVTTYLTSDVTVTVNNVPVLVDYVNGVTGEILLAAPPGPGAVTKIDYFYKSDCAVFQGKSWAVGDNGTILNTTNLGSTWDIQTSGTGFNLEAIDFVSQTEGWVVGAQSVIRSTQDGGTSWFGQLTNVGARQVQQVYLEGNNGGLSGNNSSSPFLTDNMIHPDVQIETTERVQVQYKIRILEATDPIADPEVISPNVKGEGPNTSGSFYYENLGPINGDYGCWRAECLNTVDGYVYAIPMFFVNRRNTNTIGYNVETNPNGQHTSTTIRPDLLTATNVVSSDILDVRHKIINQSVEEIFAQTFEALSSNTLHTNFGRSSAGTFFGNELLQVDSFSGTGQLTDAVNGNINSDSSVQTVSFLKFADNIDRHSFVPPSPGIFHPDPTHYKASYADGDAAGKPIPGQFYGMDTQDASFVFNNNALMFTAVTNYNLSADFIGDSTQSLSKTPTSPQLVQNYNSTNSYFYQGVMDNTSRIVELWDSGISGYTNYTVVYPTTDIFDITQQYRASNVELHYFIKATPSTLVSGNLVIPTAVIVNGETTAPYNIFTVKHVYNRTASPGILHRINNVSFADSGTLKITPVSGGYEFSLGIVYEVVAAVTSAPSSTNIRNGASVNFTSHLRKIDKFTQSIDTSAASDLNATTWTFTSTDNILGWSTTDTASDINKAVCWVNTNPNSLGAMREVAITRISDNSIQIEGANQYFTEYATIQLLLQKTVLDYPNDNLNVGYNYNPYQGQILPESLTVDFVNNPVNMYVSSLGTGGGSVVGSPYVNPLEHIPVNTPSITNDNRFSNFVQMKLANYFVDSGFLQLPILNGNTSGSNITLSAPINDALNRPFYSTSSKEMKFLTEGLQLSIPRKIYVPVLARVKDNSNPIFLKDEFVLLIFSRQTQTDKENVTGYYAGGDCSISVYRIPNKPLIRS